NPRSKTIYGSPVETSEPYSQNYTQSNDNLNYKIIIRCSTNFVKHCSFLLKINEKIDSLNLIKQSIVIISLQNFRFFSFPYFSCTVANTTLILPSFIIKLLPSSVTRFTNFFHYFTSPSSTVSFYLF